MTDPDRDREFVAQLFGVPSQPEPEPSDDEAETNDAESRPEVEAEPSTEPEAKSDPVEEHRKLLVDLFRGGGAAKREADERFFRALHPPVDETKEGDE